MKLTVLITFFNEENILTKTHDEMSRQLDSMLGIGLSDYELLNSSSRSLNNSIDSLSSSFSFK
ncbi:hypothetical protein GUT184_17800 [Streptococcus ruminantium]|nr:hypothetical protein GUT184_17800 [Streptococcus ruminantium]